MGKAFCYGDNVDTDVIIPARYLTTSDEKELAKHVLEDLDPNFVSAVQAGDVVVAGNNFGCGSSREHAPLALKGAGVSAVVARSFARIFFRNSINTGLPIVVSPEAVDGIEPGDSVEVDVAAGRVHNRTKGSSFTAEPLPEFVMEIVNAGGLVPYIRRRLDSQEIGGGPGEPARPLAAGVPPPEDRGHLQVNSVGGTREGGVA